MTHILDEWADDFNRVMRDRAARLGKPVEPEPLREDTKAALAAVAPLIRAAEARSIAKACDELTSMAPSSVGMVADLLHARADKLEREADHGNHR